MISGVTLQYQGRKYSGKQEAVLDPAATKLEQLKYNFSEIGALVIRFHIGHGQRAGLLQQIARADYAENPVEKPAHGKNQTDLFSVPDDASPAYRITRMLEEAAHYSLGRGKLLNERAQPLVHVNNGTSGEQAIWDIIHSPVWNTGINLSSQLFNQGFTYILHPANITAEEHASITNELNKGQYEIVKNEDLFLPNVFHTHITTHSGIELATSTFSELEISVDPEKLKTTQDNKLMIGCDGKQAPLGWIIDKNNKLLNHDLTDCLIRIIKISKGGFYELTPAEQQVMQAGLLKNNGNGLFTQNQVFNAMDEIFAIMENKHAFDPSKLLSDKALTLTYTRLQTLTNKDGADVIEDFLTGILTSEMVQHLKVTQEKSPRSKLPLRFTNPYPVTLNNAKAIAYSFDLKTKNNEPILKSPKDSHPISYNDGLLDVQVNGKLQDPELKNPRHTAGLLATGLLVAEQMIIEQLLRDAFVYGDQHPNAIALQEILGDDNYQALLKLVTNIPEDNNGPILGLQLPYCDKMVDLVRKSLWRKQQTLAVIIQDLKNGDPCLDEIDNPELAGYLYKLFQIGEKLQELTGISAANQQSRGINAGLLPVMKKMTPALHAELTSRGDFEKYNNETTEPLVKDSKSGNFHAKQCDLNDTESGASCPYLNGTPSQKHEPLQSTKSAKKSGGWCNLFTKQAAPVVVAAASSGFTLAWLLMRSRII